MASQGVIGMRVRQANGSSEWRGAERGEAATEGVQPKPEETEVELKRNKCWVRHILTLAVSRTDGSGMKHNMKHTCSGEKTEETWKAGERADGIILSSSKCKLRHCFIAAEHD